MAKYSYSFGWSHRTGKRSASKSNGSIGSNFILCETCGRYIPRSAYDAHKNSHQLLELERGAQEAGANQTTFNS